MGGRHFTGGYTASAVWKPTFRAPAKIAATSARSYDSWMAQTFAERFGRPAEVRAYAPGRIEFIGNHLDYNGGTVVGAAIDRGIEVAAGPRHDRWCHLFSQAFDEEVRVSIDDLEAYSGQSSWARYPAAVLFTMRRENLPISRGCDLLISSDLPAGAGLGSSAALELATAYAVAVMNEVELTRARMVQICRRAENEVVGMPCGILDQAVSAFGAPNHLVVIDCLTENIHPLALPPGAHLWMVNSNTHHALVDSAYARRHRECAEAFAILKGVDPSVPCLARISPERVRAERHRLSELQYRRALHVSEEQLRVEQAVAALHLGDLYSLGVLLTTSHRSSQRLFENSSPELDYLVDHLTSAKGVYGARLSGGGFGGTVLALTDQAFAESGRVKEMAAGYEQRFGRGVQIEHTHAGPGATILEA